MTHPILYTFRRCPYAMRARLAIHSSGTHVEMREISLKNKPAELVEKSAKATTPTLVLPNGDVIDESMDIMHWALQQNDPQELMNYSSSLNELININDGDFKHALDRYKYITRYPEDADEDWRNKAYIFIEQLEQQLAQHRYLASDKLTLLDYAIFPFLRQFRMPDKEWFDTCPTHPHVRNWLEHCIALPEFNAIMEKFPLWKTGQKPIIWPK